MSRPSREERHAKRVAEAYRRFDEALPDMLDRVRERILAKDTPPGVFVQSLGTLEKMLALLPKPAMPEGEHLTALQVAAAMNRIAANPAKYIVQPVDAEIVRAEHARYDVEKAALEAKIEEVRALKATYLEEMETRPLGCPAPAPIEFESPAPEPVEPDPPAQTEPNPSTEEAIGSDTQRPVPTPVTRAQRRKPPDDPEPPRMLTDFRRERF